MRINQTIKHKAYPVVSVKCTPKYSELDFYAPNRDLHKDLNVPLVGDPASTRYKSFHSSFHLHTNTLVLALSPLQIPMKCSASTECGTCG
jgi:hypothetical protein